MRSSQSRPAAPSPLWALYQCLTWYWILNLEITVLQDEGGIVNARYQKNFRISFPFLLFYLVLLKKFQSLKSKCTTTCFVLETNSNILFWISLFLIEKWNSFACPSVHPPLPNQRQVSRSRGHSRPIRGQCSPSLPSRIKTYSICSLMFEVWFGGGITGSGAQISSKLKMDKLYSFFSLPTAAAHRSQSLDSRLHCNPKQTRHSRT